MIEYKERLLEAMGLRAMTVASLSKALSISYQAVKKVVNGKSASFGLVNNQRAAQVLGVSADWLATGQGSMLPALATHTGEQVQSAQAMAVLMASNPEFPAIRRVRLKLSAGASGFGIDYILDDAAPIVFQKEWFVSRGFQPDKLLAVKVANGSMEPGLHDGDTVIINVGDINLKDGEVYAMNYEGELVIKRLMRDAGQWWLCSDNPDQRRYQRKVCSEDVFCVGRIVHKQSERI